MSSFGPVEFNVEIRSLCVRFLYRLKRGVSRYQMSERIHGLYLPTLPGSLQPTIFRSNDMQ